jgi:hypothetical protein
MATEEYEAQVRSHHRAYAERSAARAANAALPEEAGYGVSGGVSPSPKTPPTSRLVNPKYLVSPEEADAAGYGVTPAVAPNQPDADTVEYIDPTQHYVDYNDDDDDNNVPESPRKQKGGNSRLVSVQPDVPLDGGTLRARPTSRQASRARDTPVFSVGRSLARCASMAARRRCRRRLPQRRRRRAAAAAAGRRVPSPRRRPSRQPTSPLPP